MKTQEIKIVAEILNGAWDPQNLTAFKKEGEKIEEALARAVKKEFGSNAKIVYIAGPRFSVAPEGYGLGSYTFYCHELHKEQEALYVAEQEALEAAEREAVLSEAVI